jgi:hypothetical protein
LPSDLFFLSELANATTVVIVLAHGVLFD